MALLVFSLPAGCHGNDVAFMDLADVGLTVADAAGGFCREEGDTSRRSVGSITITNDLSETIVMGIDLGRNVNVEVEVAVDGTPVLSPGEGLLLKPGGRADINVIVDGFPPADAFLDLEADMDADDPAAGSKVKVLRGTRRWSVRVNPKPSPPPAGPQLPSLAIFGLQGIDPEAIALDIECLRFAAQGAPEPLAWIAGSNGVAQPNVCTGAASDAPVRMAENCPR